MGHADFLHPQEQLLRGVNKLTRQLLGFFFIRKHCPNKRKLGFLESVNPFST